MNTRTGWFSNNHETPNPSRHQPSAARIPNTDAWEPTCSCRPGCAWGSDDTRRQYPTHTAAAERAAECIRNNENGPA